MKIRAKITLLFTFITATILLAFASIIYYSAKEARKREFFASLKKEAVTKANLYFNAKVNAQILQDIYKNNRVFLTNEVEVAIYDSSFHLLYHDALEIDAVKETKQMIHDIYRKGELQYEQNDWQVVGLRYPFQGKDFIITAVAYDQYGYKKLNLLFRNSALSFVISILFIYIAGRFFSKKAFAPVTEMTEKAKTISATNLDLRLTDNRNKDELSELAGTFNEMLNRLENSFDAQKHFVSNISHELRTPLAAIIAELELSANKNRSTEEYKTVIANALQDAKKLVKLSNSLLDLAKASYDPAEIAIKRVRIDEILLDARHQIQDINADYRIEIHFENNSEEDSEMLVQGNEYLLKVAFANLFENGCKFSPNHRCAAAISFTNSHISIQFSDDGIGISAEDRMNIFKPFYRGNNKGYAEGNGIGLFMTEKIIGLHKGKISVSSLENRGSRFTVELPHG